jgi:hypothetical protein
VKQYGQWGKQTGLRALEELFYILRDEIPDAKFYWEAFFLFKEKDGLRGQFDVPDGCEAGRTMIESINGNEEFCGSQACVAGWAVSTHPHLLRWVEGVGLVLPEDEEKARDCTSPGTFDMPEGRHAFAKSFGITADEAHEIMFGFDSLDMEVKDSDDYNERQEALVAIADVLADHGVKTQAERPSYLA